MVLKAAKDNGYFQILNEFIVLEKGTLGVPLDVKLWNPNLWPKFTSQNPNVATVDDRGHVTPKSMGSTVITASFEGGFKDECQVYVLDKFFTAEETVIGKGIDITRAAAVTIQYINKNNPVPKIVGKQARH